ncbi:hypothetical protein LC613_08320 [Nostoc sphaeroides CHAB 2801]|uniref:hypothetical protein n=1 Tax=Nostoc sphaeroides TaxID=446679 RepID=UPI001E5BFDCA|nr:hypothetical protein [Nostoc sphaeroides]MCC5628128.1 hypothetical protein [Nostoc sphaeroides CHAB 2801]
MNGLEIAIAYITIKSDRIGYLQDKLLKQFAILRLPSASLRARRSVQVRFFAHSQLRFVTGI